MPTLISPARIARAPTWTISTVRSPNTRAEAKPVAIGRLPSALPALPPSAQQRHRILTQAQTVAVVGASNNSSRASYFVMTYLMSSSADYDIYPVNPRLAGIAIAGAKVYASLEDLPVVPDIVDVFRRSDELPAIASETIAVGAAVFWAQLGLWSPQAVEVCVAACAEVVMDRCLKIEHARFNGGLHLAGFDTGVINSRRASRLSGHDGTVAASAPR